MRLASKVAINVSALTAGRLLNSITGIVAVGFAARYLHPDAYGALITGVAFTGLMAPLAELGVSTIGAREISKRPAETSRLLGGVFTVSLLLSLATFAVGVAAAFLVYPGAANELEREAILLLLLPTLVLAPATTAGTYFIAEQKNYLGMIASVLGSLSLITIVVLSATLDWGFTGVAAAYGANGAVFSVAMVALAARQKLRLRPSLDRELCTRLFRWALPLGGSLLVGALYWRLDVVLLSLLADREEVGPYGLAFKVVDVLMTVPGYMMLTLLPELARLSEQRERLDEVVQKAFDVMQTGAAPMVVFLAVFAHPVVTLIGGPEFSGAAPILQLLMVGVLIAYVGNVPVQAMVALNQQRSLFIITIAALIPNVALNLVFIPLWGGEGAAAAYVATEALILGLVLARFAKVATVPRPVHPWRFLIVLGLMAGVGLINVLPGIRDASVVVELAVGGVLSAAVYIGALYALHAVPAVVHESLVVPLWTRLRPGRAH